MDNIKIVKAITNSFCENRYDEKTLSEYFAPDFKHTANGIESGLKGYSEHLGKYAGKYENFKVENWDELFAAGDRVVASYTLSGNKKDGSKDKTAVMAIWNFANGKVTALREVDAAV